MSRREDRRPLELEGLEPFVYPRKTNPAAVLLREATNDETRRNVRKSLRAIMRCLWSAERIDELRAAGRTPELSIPWHAFDYEKSLALREELARRYSPGGANLRLSHFRAGLRSAWRLEWIDRDAYERAADVKRIRGRAALRGREVRASEVRAVFDQCDPIDTAGLRDRAMIALLSACGLRRSEVCRLRFPDDVEGGRISVRGKGDAVRSAYLGPVEAILDRWIRRRGDWRGALFPRIERGGGVAPRRAAISPSAVSNMLERRIREALDAGTLEDPFTPHDLRRTFATNLYAGGAQDSEVMALLGHSRVETTRIYDRGEADRARARAEGMRSAFE